MHRFSIFSLFSIIVLMTFNAGAARAEICSETIRDYLDEAKGREANSAHFSLVASAQCTERWSGTLARSGVAAKIQSEQGGVTTNLAWLVREVREGLEIADDALIKIRPDGSIGTHIDVILSKTNVKGHDYPDDPPDAYTFYRQGTCTLVITPTAQKHLGQPGAIAFIMAHELFHCVQNASLPLFGKDADLWWAEGSANWFAYMAQPNVVVDAYAEFEKEFERDAQRKTLGNFSYESWPFFAWVAQYRGGAQAVMVFLRGMPIGKDNSDAEIAALLSPDDWDEFAKQYSAYQIKISDRVPLDPRPRFRLSETDIHMPNIGDVRHIPFHMRTGGLNRYQINLEEGDWEFTTTLPGTMYLSELATSGDPGPNWQKISTSTEKLELSVACDKKKKYALVGFGSSPDAHDFTLTVRKTDDPCAEATCTDVPTERDMCVIGIWEDQGPIEDYLSATRTTTEAAIVPVDTFYPDGSYTKDAPLTIVNEVLGSRITTTLNVVQTLGEWGTKGNKLLICETTQITKGTVHTVHADGELTVPIDKNKTLEPSRSFKYTYTCDDSTLTMKIKPVLLLTRGVNLTFKRQ